MTRFYLMFSRRLWSARLLRRRRRELFTCFPKHQRSSKRDFLKPFKAIHHLSTCQVLKAEAWERFIGIGNWDLLFLDFSHRQNEKRSSSRYRSYWIKRSGLSPEIAHGLCCWYCWSLVVGISTCHSADPKDSYRSCIAKGPYSRGTDFIPSVF